MPLNLSDIQLLAGSDQYEAMPCLKTYRPFDVRLIDLMWLYLTGHTT